MHDLSAKLRALTYMESIETDKRKAVAGSPDSDLQISKTKRKQLIWPDPVAVEPQTTHTASVIVLHGRGGNGENFGFEFIKAPTRAGKNLQELFPGVKFIFPTAKKRRSTVLKRTPINQWFDNYSLVDPSQRQDLQYDGLQETSVFIHGLIEEEIRLLGSASKVVLGGLSQGCAASLHVLLNWQPEQLDTVGSLAGFFGMSGWLPFASTLSTDAEDDDNANIDFEGDDVYENEEQKDDLATEQSKDLDLVQKSQIKAANVARDIASLPELDDRDRPAFAATPIFLGHGLHDEKVSVRLGEQARDVFKNLGCKVSWIAYDEGHWYKVPDQIDDIADFLSRCLGSQS